jgi:hypothetical protein
MRGRDMHAIGRAIRALILRRHTDDHVAQERELASMADWPAPRGGNSLLRMICK